MMADRPIPIGIRSSDNLLALLLADSIIRHAPRAAPAIRCRCSHVRGAHDEATGACRAHRCPCRWWRPG